MIDPVTVSVSGVRESVAALDAMEKKIVRTVVAKAVRAGAKPAIKKTKELAPRRGAYTTKSGKIRHKRGVGGSLRRSIIQKVKRYRRGAFIVSVIGPKDKLLANKENPGKYAHLLELGVRPHSTRKGARLVKKSRNIIWRGLSRLLQLLTGSAKHPGVKARHFLKRAAEIEQQHVFREFNAKLVRETDAEARKIGARNGVK